MQQDPCIATYSTQMYRGKQSSVKREIDRMSQVNETLDMETDRRLEGLEANVLRVLSALKSHTRDLWQPALVIVARRQDSRFGTRVHRKPILSAIPDTA